MVEMGHLSAPASDTWSPPASNRELWGRAEPAGGGHGGERSGPASPAVCRGAAAVWGGKWSDRSLPGWDPLPRAAVTGCLICMGTYGPTCASISCRISLCSVMDLESNLGPCN